ncbi:MAG TPA: recombinase family protein [Tepidisphaeraceae bacterium]|nr:recombinase family protein [Tepidisphaeraceae bacterium]
MKKIIEPQKTIRCAIYTRKSTEEGLQQAFNTLDAQRESAEADIASQKTEGWTCLPDRYDDGGFTGGNLERPAVQRLMKDIEAGLVDCVVVYKVDRLSRSLLDFAKLMEVFDRHKVALVSVTQHFNTTHGMGRLTLNVLLSFAQFEREIISERIRDKIAAARRKGKFAGGRPVLGYDVLRSPQGPKLVVNDTEATQVRRIFSIYLYRRALIPAVAAITELGWTAKAWVGRDGTPRGGQPFNKSTLHQLPTNVVYTGKVRYKEEVHPGEHAAIVDDETYQKVQAVLSRNGKTGGAAVRNRHGALLKGILRCSPCDCSMGNTYSSKGTKRYRYYVCLNAHKRGWDTCQSKSVPAAENEAFVVEQIRSIGSDPAVVAETVRAARAQVEGRLAELKAEDKRLEKAAKQDHATVLRLIGLDHASRSCLIDTGRALATVFAGYVRREFGNAAVRVQRVTLHVEEGER